MNLLSAKVSSTAGAIYINGVEESMNKYKKLMGFVPQVLQCLS
jgi:ABC-type multidrug transport system ATPase subunit